MERTRIPPDVCWKTISFQPKKEKWHKPMGLASNHLKKANRIETPACKVTAYVPFKAADHTTCISYQQNLSTKEFLGYILLALFYIDCYKSISVCFSSHALLSMGRLPHLPHLRPQPAERIQFNNGIFAVFSLMLRPHTLAIHPFAQFSAVDIAKAYNIAHSTDRSLCETVTGRPLQHNETNTLTNS